MTDFFKDIKLIIGLFINSQAGHNYITHYVRDYKLKGSVTLDIKVYLWLLKPHQRGGRLWHYTDLLSSKLSTKVDGFKGQDKVDVRLTTRLASGV